MKVYYQGIMDWLDNEIKNSSASGSETNGTEELLRTHKLAVLQDVRDNMNRIIKEEHQKIMKETDEKIWDAR